MPDNQFVDNVDNLFLDCPQCPQNAWERKPAKRERERFVDNVDNVDSDFKSLAYNIVSIH